MKHSSHPEIGKRLRRAEGHLRTVISMIEAEKPCMDIAQQLHAVEAAISKAKKALIHDHIDHCLADEHAANGHSQLGELRQLAKYL